MDKVINDLQSAMNRRTAVMPTRIRPFTTEKSDLPRAVSVTGPRGVGKTTFLLYHCRGKKMLYVSADNPLLTEQSLYTYVTSIFMAGYEGVIIDEVHFARDWSQSLKALYDDFPSHSVWVSDSSSLVLRAGTGDLSRRFLNIQMPLLSFREFLFLETDRLYPVYDPFTNSSALPVEPSSGILDAFRTYRSAGTRPFYSEKDFSSRLLSVLDKSLYFDIPFFLPSVNEGNLRLMKAVTATLAYAAVPRLNVNSLCADWSIGSDKLYQLIAVMEEVGILRVIRYENDKKARTVGAKLFLADPALYSALDGNLGTARESLAAMLCFNAGWTVEASKDEMQGDFVLTKRHNGNVKKILAEIGGPDKSIKNADVVIRDLIDYPGRNSIPLWLLGMSY